MKKMLFLFVFSILTSAMAYSQGYGDTVDIFERQPGYYYYGLSGDMWLDSIDVCPSEATTYSYDAGFWQYRYSDIPLRVKGIAAVLFN